MLRLMANPIADSVPPDSPRRGSRPSAIRVVAHLEVLERDVGDLTALGYFVQQHHGPEISASSPGGAASPGRRPDRGRRPAPSPATRWPSKLRRNAAAGRTARGSRGARRGRATTTSPRRRTFWRAAEEVEVLPSAGAPARAPRAVGRCRVDPAVLPSATVMRMGISSGLQLLVLDRLDVGELEELQALQACAAIRASRGG